MIVKDKPIKMKNTRENAENFLFNFGKGKSFVDRLEGIPDFVDLLTEYGNKINSPGIKQSWISKILNFLKLNQ